MLAAACRTYDEVRGKRSFAFVAKSPAHTTNVMRILLTEAPKELRVGGKEVSVEGCWDEASHTCLLRFENDPDGVQVRIGW